MPGWIHDYKIDAVLLFHLFPFISLVAERPNRWSFLCLCVKTGIKLPLSFFCLLILKKTSKWRKSARGSKERSPISMALCSQSAASN